MRSEKLSDIMKKIEKKAKANPKAFYQYVNSKTKSQTQIADIKSENGHVLTNNKVKAELC